MRILILGLLLCLPAEGAAACNGFLGVDYAAINAQQILIQGVIRSVRPVGLIRENIVSHAFEIDVRATLKGPPLPSWTVLIDLQGVYRAWPEKSDVYLGSELVDPFQGVGRIRRFSPCRPVGIVPATQDNLKKIYANAQETPGPW